jgi:IS1 family transposase
MANNLPTEKKIMAISALAEGSSIRIIERMTGVHRDTVMRLGVRVGEACAKLMDEKMRDLPCTEMECDEIWGFIGKKKKNATEADRQQGIGDIWTFIALDPVSKVIPAFRVGKRDSYNAKAFMEDLAGRMSKRIQLSTDAMSAYDDAVERAFGANVDYAQLFKTYSLINLNKDAASRYSPAEVVKVDKIVKQGLPDWKRISTSRVEKQNHTLRMHCRRLTRLTNAFSKRLENFEAAVALNFAYYNFVKVHGAVRTTPAMAIGVEPSIWTVAELVERCGE